MTAFPRCPECNGQRVPMNYVGDVVGAVCMCPVSKSTLYGPWNAFDMDNWSEFTKMLVAERDRLRAEVEALRVGDALHKVCVQQRDRAWREVESLRSKAAAFDEWLAKTEWVQETAEAGELGTHRADVMRKRIEALRADNKHLRGEFEKAWPDAERYRHLISAEPAWVVSLFENGFRPAEIVDLIDAARAAEEKK